MLDVELDELVELCDVDDVDADVELTELEVLENELEVELIDVLPLVEDCEVLEKLVLDIELEVLLTDVLALVLDIDVLEILELVEEVELLVLDVLSEVEDVDKLLDVLDCEVELVDRLVDVELVLELVEDIDVLLALVELVEVVVPWGLSLNVAIPQAHCTEGFPVKVAVYAPVVVTNRSSIATSMVAFACCVRLTKLPPAVKVAEIAPPTPINNSNCWLVAVVAPELSAVLLPALVEVLSRTVTVSIPEYSWITTAAVGADV